MSSSLMCERPFSLPHAVNILFEQLAETAWLFTTNYGTGLAQYLIWMGVRLVMTLNATYEAPRWFRPMDR